MDVAAPPEAIREIGRGVLDGALNFSQHLDGKIAFSAPQGFIVYLDLIEIGGGCIERIHVTEPFGEGSLASMSDLLLLRAVTVVERGADGDVLDFQWLLAKVAGMGELLVIDGEELGTLRTAVEACLGKLGCLVLAAILSSENAAEASGLLEL